MKISLNIILDQLRSLPLEVHVKSPGEHMFCRGALLPRDYNLMKKDLLHVCRLSDALRASSVAPDRFYLCIRDRITDGMETDERLKGMIIINKNLEIELLLDKLQEIFDNVSEFYRKMQDALIHESSLQSILDLTEPIIGNTINISDSAFTLLARTNNIETDDPTSLALSEFGYHPESTLQLFRQYHLFEVWNNAQSMFVDDSRAMSPYDMVNKVFRFRNTYFTHVVMVCDHHPLSAGLLELFSMLTDILAIYSEKNWKKKNALSHNYDTFFHDLLTGAMTNPMDVAERAQYLGLATTGWFRLMCISVGDNMEAALGRIARELSELILGCQVLVYEHSVLALVHLRQNGGIGIPEETLIHFLQVHQARCGMSDDFSGLEHLQRAYEQASLALKYSGSLRGTKILNSLMELPKASPLCSFQSRVLYGILGKDRCNEANWRDSTYYKALKTLYEHDKLHGTNNLQLLRTYLWYERKATETGQVLHMHRNNVIYRISRIEQLVGLSLDDHETRIGIEMSFMLLELYSIPDNALTIDD